MVLIEPSIHRTHHVILMSVIPCTISKPKIVLIFEEVENSIILRDPVHNIGEVRTHTLLRDKHFFDSCSHQEIILIDFLELSNKAVQYLLIDDGVVILAVDILDGVEQSGFKDAESKREDITLEFIIGNFFGVAVDPLVDLRTHVDVGSLIQIVLLVLGGRYCVLKRGGQLEMVFLGKQDVARSDIALTNIFLLEVGSCGDDVIHQVGDFLVGEEVLLILAGLNFLFESLREVLVELADLEEGGTEVRFLASGVVLELEHELLHVGVVAVVAELHLAGGLLDLLDELLLVVHRLFLLRDLFEGGPILHQCEFSVAGTILENSLDFVLGLQLAGLVHV